MSFVRMLLIFAFAPLAALGASPWWPDADVVLPPRIPDRFARDLPGSCQQVLLMVCAGPSSSAGTLWQMERADAIGGWHAIAGPIAVSIGRNGLAWGAGEHHGEIPPGLRAKREGDGCSPAGVFRIPFAFGYAKAAPELRMAYLPTTPHMVGIDDVRSKFYNRVVDSSSVTNDWNSVERMQRPDNLYRQGAFVAHNPNNIPGGGSCIFMHIWQGRGRPTSGCTAMAEDQLGGVLRWLDPAREPRLVQTVATW